MTKPKRFDSVDIFAIFLAATVVTVLNILMWGYVIMVVVGTLYSEFGWLAPIGYGSACVFAIVPSCLISGHNTKLTVQK